MTLTTTRSLTVDASLRLRPSVPRRAGRLLMLLLAVLAVAATGLVGRAAPAAASVGDPPLCNWDGNPSFNRISVELPTSGSIAYGTTVRVYLLRWNGYSYAYDGVTGTAVWNGGAWEGNGGGLNVVDVHPWRHGYYRIATRVSADGASTAAQTLTWYRKAGPGWNATG